MTSLLICIIALFTLNDPPINQSRTYSKQIWRSADGLPEDFAQAITQTHDGYLWIGTSGGLVRFDGVTFTVFNKKNTPAFKDDSVYSLLVSTDGAIWAGTEGGGLVRYYRGTFKSYGVAEGLTNGFVRVIFQDKLKRLWIGTDAGLFQFKNERLFRIDGKNGLPFINVHSICEERMGKLLVGGWGLLVLDELQQSVYYTSSESQADNSVRTIKRTADGSIWIGSIAGLRKIDRSVTSNPFDTPKILTGQNISYLYQSKNNALWIGTYGNGVKRLTGGHFTNYSTPKTLPHNNVLSIFEDSENNIWVGTQGGLLRLSPGAGTTITPNDGIPLSINTVYKDKNNILAVSLSGKLYKVSDRILTPIENRLNRLTIRNVFRDSHGTLWIGTDGQGIACIKDNLILQFTTKQGLVSDFIRAFCEDRNGNLWIGTDGGLSRMSLNQPGRFNNYKTENGLIYESIRAVITNRRGGLWIATDGGLSYFNGSKFEKLPTQLNDLKIWAIYEDAESKLWIGTVGNGLLSLHNGIVRNFTATVGLPSNKIYFVGEDSKANLWMSGPSGISVVSRKELEYASASHKLAVKRYNTSEGIITDQMSGGVQNSGVLNDDGVMWFASTKGLVRIRPEENLQRKAPPTFIEKIIVDDHLVPLNNLWNIKPGRGNVEIHYTAISLRSPDRIRFKYRLEEFDQDWIDAGHRNVAFYTNLPPGAYHFQVIAYETDAPERTSDARLRIGLRPHFYQTAWFIALCLLGVGVISLMSYKVHVRNIRRRFSAVLDERNRLAREMHDTLIQGCVGVSALLEASAGARAVSSDISVNLIDRARDEIRVAVDEARFAVWNLRQNSSGNLVDVATHLIRRIQSETAVMTTIDIAGAPYSLGGDNDRNLLMILREALNNSIRHACPKNIHLQLTFTQLNVLVAVIDDGCGFDTSRIYSNSSTHYGLIGMRERAEMLHGKLEIVSSENNGTSIHITIPSENKIKRNST